MLAFRQNLTLVTIGGFLTREKIRANILNNVPNSHGFIPYPKGSFDIFVDYQETTIKYVLYHVCNPSEIPYELNFDLDLTIFKILQISEFIKTVNIVINFTMTEEKVLPLSVMSFNDTRVSLNITGIDKPIFLDSIGSSIVDLNLSHIVICQDKIFTDNIEKLNLKYVTFEIPNVAMPEIEDVEIELLTFIELEKMNYLQKHYKHLRITNIHHITFTKAGFIFGLDSGIESIHISEMVETLEISTSCIVKLDFSYPTNQRSI